MKAMGGPEEREAVEAPGGIEVIPVCSMTVDPKTAEKAVYWGRAVINHFSWEEGACRI